MRDTIFISYSHKNPEWREAFEKALSVGVLRGKYELWSDQEIQPGTDWRSRIDSALGHSRVALLLVTRDFTQSKFVAEDELKRIFALHKTVDLVIKWVQIHKI